MNTTYPQAMMPSKPPEQINCATFIHGFPCHSVHLVLPDSHALPQTPRPQASVAVTFARPSLHDSETTELVHNVTKPQAGHVFVPDETTYAERVEVTAALHRVFVAKYGSWLPEQYDAATKLCNVIAAMLNETTEMKMKCLEANFLPLYGCLWYW
uniref:Adenylate kinase n=1 Tax=Lygus hesperus TaxID=30085 RepID=A0A0A9XPH4_LYGHE